MRRPSALFLLALAAGAPPGFARMQAPTPAPASPASEIEKVIDAFHAAAARADEGAYFALMAPRP